MMASSESKTCTNQWPAGVAIAAPQGRSGKTIVSVGLCAGFRRRGFVVQPFKKGPDYIDPSWLSAAAGRSCRNLDSFLMPERKLLASFQQACQGADLAIIEGAMGLYDGLGSAGRGSTAWIARLLHIPVILVVNTARMTGSIGAMVSGYQHFQPDTRVAAVILNNVSGSRHQRKLVTAVEQFCGIPVVGSIPRDPNLNIAERHLGLIPFIEAEQAEAVIERILQIIEPHVNLDGILAIARSAEASPIAGATGGQSKAAITRVGIMLDRVFNFYYPENLEALQQNGAELVFIDSLREQVLPDIDGLYIGGGFPELYLKELEANTGLRRDIAQAVEDGLPVYAECAGLMYLCQGIRSENRRHEMVGVIPAEVQISRRPQGHGYVVAEVAGKNPLFPVGLTVRGHEFHHSSLSFLGATDFAYRMRRGQGIDGKVDGIIYKNVFAAYTHLHTLGVPQWAEAFVSLSALRHKHRNMLSTIKA